jgi:hypothetical protein
MIICDDRNCTLDSGVQNEQPHAVKTAASGPR